MIMPFEAVPEDEDAALLARYAQGDAEAARQLTQRLTPRIYAHAMRMMGNTAEAEDICQEALMRLWRVAPNWRAGEAKVTTWLFRVTANLCTDRMRRRGTVTLDAVPEPVDDTASVAQDMQTRARADALQSALQCLPDRQRQAVVLRHIDGLANPEIATIMGLGTRAVESLTARGKRALTQILAGRKDELGYTDD
ncbi:MAG: RNA polymerase sigma factor [Primorskyibacter sp.]